MGKAATVFTIGTSAGLVYYEAFAEGKSNALRVTPLTNGMVPHGAKFRQSISIYNPFSQWFQITEMYSSDPRIQIEVAHPGRAPEVAAVEPLS